MSNPTPTQTLTSTTAPGKTFSSRSELANHYKSDWHKYNLKRREVNMTMLPYEAFNARLEAALALKKEREMRDERSGKDHLKDHNGASKKKKKNKKNDKNKNKKNNNNNNNTKKNQTNNTTDDDANDNDRHDNDNDDDNEEYETKPKTTERKLSKRQLRQQEKRGIIPSLPNNNDDTTMDAVEEEDETKEEEQKEQEPPVIDPNQSLFDNHISPNIDANIEYMYKKYGFFIPDIEFLVDKIGFIGYCHEKIKLGHTCLYCQKVFSTWEGCQKHMISKSHAKLRYEKGIDLEEFDVFYDFTSDDVDFLNSGIGNYKNKSSASRKKRNKKLGLVNEDDADAIGEKLESMNVDDNDSDDDSGEWEDIDSDEEMEEEEEDGLYAAYQDEIAQHGLDITPLGELVFPDGRIIGHRGLNRYYKQRITLADSRASVVAVRRANGERLLDGRVYDTYAPANPTDGNGNVNTMELVKAGLAIGAVRGRQGKGILVPTNGAIGGNSSSYTALSLYRYKAVVKKARKEEFRARRLVERTSLPMNKMDKKANRLFNNVSVAHAPR